MATKAINIKLDENRVYDVKNIASIFHMSITDVINEALDLYLPKMKKDPFYKLTVNIQDASKEETKEILSEIDKLTDEDLSIAKVEKMTV